MIWMLAKNAWLQGKIWRIPWHFKTGRNVPRDKDQMSHLHKPPTGKVPITHVSSMSQVVKGWLFDTSTARNNMHTYRVRNLHLPSYFHLLCKKWPMPTFNLSLKQLSHPKKKKPKKNSTNDLQTVSKRVAFQKRRKSCLKKGSREEGYYNNQKIHIYI